MVKAISILLLAVGTICAADLVLTGLTKEQCLALSRHWMTNRQNEFTITNPATVTKYLCGVIESTNKGEWAILIDSRIVKDVTNRLSVIELQKLAPYEGKWVPVEDDIKTLEK